jgi:hypothetical protein
MKGKEMENMNPEELALLACQKAQLRADRIHWNLGPGLAHDKALSALRDREVEYAWLTEGFLGLAKLAQKERESE